MPDRKFGFDTLCLHAGQIPDAATGARALPIYQTTSFVFDSVDHAASLFNLQTFGNVYSRISNPTVCALEERVAALEGGRAALAAATGMAAQTAALLTLAKNGDHIVAARTLYGGTYTQFAVTFAELGIDTTFVDPDDPDDFRRAVKPNTKALYAETIGNPQLNVVDLAALADIAHVAGVPLVIDNTLASPYLCRPIEHGADIVVHSATKFLGGHGTSIGGIIIDSGKFAWTDKYPAITQPSPGYHGMKFSEVFGPMAYIIKVRVEGLRDFGPCMSPFNSFLFIQGIETLSYRMQAHCANALAVAEWLGTNSAVTWVKYPGLKSSPYYSMSQKYLPKGQGSIVTFGIKGGMEAGRKLIDSVQIFSHLANLGDAKSLIIHPSSTTHQQLSETQQLDAGVTPDLVRVSVGIEDLDDIIWDLE